MSPAPMNCAASRYVSIGIMPRDPKRSQTYRSRNVRDIKARIALTSEIHSPIIHAKELHEPLPEANKLRREVIFVVDRRFSLRIAHSYGLVNPDYVREI